MCTLLYTTFTHFAVNQSVRQNRFTELRPSEITLMNRVDQSQGLNEHYPLTDRERETSYSEAARSIDLCRLKSDGQANLSNEGRSADLKATNVFCK
jgi:hypothetical protein